MAKAIEAGLPKLRIEEAAAKTQARIDAGVQSVIGVNKFAPLEDYPISVLKVDNSAVRRQQIEKLKLLRAERSSDTVRATLEALSRGAQTGGANPSGLTVEAARAKATVGEISSALETVFGRHRAEIKAISGVYQREFGAMSTDVARLGQLIGVFERHEGRRPRILVALKSDKMGTIAARRSSPRRLPILGLMWISVHFLPPRRRLPGRRSKTTCTSSGSRHSLRSSDVGA